ncbi:MAG: hypothetical protein A2418_01360 [Candidatus Brennerbacteria bacterium RIFOXYC1_FULL_41_11]|uniref:Pseudouridine synthase RsuA/RluA-like domain-containing protein n=1 Tax=Candidatus Brennerbacteria bacterium RIFOXYD1_FULL_41_16 TaxID=1797529 RepID=A0A1G1XKM0_9BACT|nr:MAG: hypothetical protein A2391_00130 [Candidatus Brennerbacteria bacterium RIFOXYB1_FULL_41_13]OGY39220.1 MAG: hypothetical protein A2418_01360 [Candidatus Brennerbacteria bacterium RIFOXYC1_FULL_41_11]OGY40502.1 MAG: hypothetical protein A2570_02020 [Candidatus Brennerbacteria bacterium RIFOXYD1_FULL_41_16]
MLENIGVIFENQDFLVINKPAGLMVHSAPEERTKNQIPDDKQISKSKFQNKRQETLADWLKKERPETEKVGDDPELRPGIVHRLDKETSGVLIIAKTQEAFEVLKNKFKNREVKKTYLALVLGKMNVSSEEINLPIAKSKKSTKRTTRIRPGQKNSEAKTNWKLLKTYSDQSGNTLSLLEVIPKTGRTHQIRVHLAAISHPVVGDYLYGRKKTKSFRETIQRIFLHAKLLELEFNKTNYSFEAELPIELGNFLDSLVEINEQT